MKIVKLILISLIVLTVIFVIWWVYLLRQIEILPTEKDHPSETELIQNYNSHKQEFNDLIENIKMDHQKDLKRIDDSWTDPSDPTTINVSNQRIREYRSTFNKLGLPRGFNAYTAPFELIANARGLSVSGSSIGYAYGTEEPQNYFKVECGLPKAPVESIDGFHNCNSNSYTIYQKIDDNWYLFFDYED